MLEVSWSDMTFISFYPVIFMYLKSYILSCQYFWWWWWGGSQIVGRLFIYSKNIIMLLIRFYVIWFDLMVLFLVFLLIKIVRWSQFMKSAVDPPIFSRHFLGNPPLCIGFSWAPSLNSDFSVNLQNVKIFHP